MEGEGDGRHPGSSGKNGNLLSGDLPGQTVPKIRVGGQEEGNNTAFNTPLDRPVAWKTSQKLVPGPEVQAHTGLSAAGRGRGQWELQPDLGTYPAGPHPPRGRGEA